VFGLLPELEGSVTGLLSPFPIPHVELDACEQDRQPATSYEQMPMLGERDLAVQEAPDVVKPALDAWRK
jgi:hypothetical protein